MTIGEKIRFLRNKNNLSQEELAKALNTTKQAIYKYENGIVTNIPIDKIETLSNVLCTTPAYLMGWTEDNKTVEIPTPDEQELLKLFRQIPADQQRVFLEMGRVYANSLKKD